MGKKPTTLPSYIDYVQNIDKCNEMKENLCERKKGLEDIKSILTKFRPKEEGYQSLPLQARIDALTADIEKTEEDMNKSHEDVLKERDAHIEDLEKRLLEEQDKVKQLVEDVLTSEKLMRAETPPKEALDAANKIKKKFDESQRKLNQYQEFQ